MNRFNKVELYRRAVCSIPVVVGGLALTACAREAGVIPDVPAKVVTHLYDDADTWTTGSINGKMIVTEERYDPEHFYIVVEQCETQEFTNDEAPNPGECNRFTVEVDKDTYNAYPDGSQITFRP